MHPKRGVTRGPRGFSLRSTVSTRLAVTGPIATVRHIDLWATPLRDRLAASVAANICAFALIAASVVFATVSIPAVVVDRLGLVLTIGCAAIAVLSVLVGIPVQLDAGHSRPTMLRFAVVTILAVLGVSLVAAILAVAVTGLPVALVASGAGIAVLCALIALPLFGPLSRRPALSFAGLGVTALIAAGMAVWGMLS